MIQRARVPETEPTAMSDALPPTWLRDPRGLPQVHPRQARGGEAEQRRRLPRDPAPRRIRGISLGADGGAPRVPRTPPRAAREPPRVATDPRAPRATPRPSTPASTRPRLPSHLRPPISGHPANPNPSSILLSIPPRLAGIRQRAAQEQVRRRVHPGNNKGTSPPSREVRRARGKVPRLRLGLGLDRDDEEEEEKRACSSASAPRVRIRSGSFAFARV